MSDIERRAIEEHIEECKKRIATIKGFLEINADRNITECKRNIWRLETTISALQEFQQYHKIGTPEECRGYKTHSQQISKLHNCNDCGRKRDCEIAPRIGGDCRINCYFWEEMEEESDETD